MPLQQVGQPRWRAYFDRIARTLGAKQVEIDVTGLRLGDRSAEEFTPLVGISYDPNSDLVAITTESVEHLVHHPTQIHVDHEVDSLHGVEIVDAEGNHHIVVLKDAIRLPPP